MSYNQVRKAINNKLRQLNYYPRVAVEFPEEKKIVYMTEVEIRAIQCIAANIYDILGKKNFDEYVSQFIIYNGPTKRKSKPMTLRTDGRFVEEFKKGFFTASCDLAIELIK